MTRPERMSHDEAIELLPWLVNESLDACEREAVKVHAASCVICRRELDELAVLQQSIGDPSARTEPPPIDMRRINARIDAQLERDNLGARVLEGLREFFRRPMHVAFAAQSLVLVAVAVVWLQPPGGDPEFRTLTSPDALPPGHYVRVVFDPDLDAMAVAALVTAFELDVVTGPSERGVYVFSFEPGMGDNDRASLLTKLQNDGRVLFAAAVNPGDGR